MVYRIAVASSDGENIDLKFRDTNGFWIYEIGENEDYSFVERRVVDEVNREENKQDEGKSCEFQKGCAAQCGDGMGCGSTLSPKIDLISDCRAILCTKAGFGIQKQLERKAISIFDIETEIDFALKKIIAYYQKVDNHISLREVRGNNK